MCPLFLSLCAYVYVWTSDKIDLQMRDVSWFGDSKKTTHIFLGNKFFYEADYK